MCAGCCHVARVSAMCVASLVVMESLIRHDQCVFRASESIAVWIGVGCGGSSSLNSQLGTLPSTLPPYAAWCHVHLTLACVLCRDRSPPVCRWVSLPSSFHIYLMRLVSVVVLLMHLRCRRIEQAYVSDTTADKCT